MRTLPALVGLLLVLLLAAPTVSAAPGSGRLAFGESAVMDGTLSGSGGGEIAVGDPDATVVGSGARVDVLRIWYETEVIQNPLGPVRTDTGPLQMQWTNFTDAGFRLAEAYADFESLVFGPDATVSFAATEVWDHSLAAYAGPWLVVDDSGVEDRVDPEDLRVFTYVADGDRFVTPSNALSADGDFTVYFGESRFLVEPAAGDVTAFASGTHRTSTSPASYKEAHVYHLVHVTKGHVAVTGADASGWLSEPVFLFDGTIRATTASGTFHLDGEAYTLDDEPVTLGGTVELRPRPLGAPERVDSDNIHVGTTKRTDGRYGGTVSDVDGDVSLLSIGGIPYVEGQNLAVVASVGVLTLVGAVLLVTPKGKWAVLAMLAPLYAKTERNRLLDNESRDRIFQAIRTNPGINLSQIHRIADLGWGVTVYHLKMMEKNGLVFSVTSARDKCFFENDPQLRLLRAAIAAIANKEPAQRVAQIVADHPGITQREVVAASGLTQRAVSYYVARLGREGLVEAKRDGNFVRYQPSVQLLEALRHVAPEQGALVLAGRAAGEQPVQA